MIDAIAAEPQFIDHLAPVWRAMPSKGRFLVDALLVDFARRRGVDAEPIDADALRQTPQAGPQFGGRLAFVASIGDIKLGRRMGYGPFAFLEHGAGQSYASRSATMASYAGGPDRADNELFLVPNHYSADLWRAAYPSARVEVVGSPHLDDLPRRVPGPGPVVAISFHGDWPSGVPYGGNALPDFAPQLAPLAKQFQVLGHCHPGKRWPDRMARLYAKAGIEFVADFEEVCRRADVYVCDNSSTIFEFAATGRPVVLMNARAWSRKGGPGLRFWDAAHVGVNVDDPRALAAAVSVALTDPPEHQRAREDALSIVYAYRTGAAERAAAAVMDWVGSRQAVAA